MWLLIHALTSTMAYESTIDVWAWMNNFIPYNSVISFPYPYTIQCLLLKGVPNVILFVWVKYVLVFNKNDDLRHFTLKKKQGVQRTTTPLSP